MLCSFGLQCGTKPWIQVTQVGPPPQLWECASSQSCCWTRHHSGCMFWTFILLKAREKVHHSTNWVLLDGTETRGTWTFRLGCDLIVSVYHLTVTFQYLILLCPSSYLLQYSFFIHYWVLYCMRLGFPESLSLTTTLCRRHCGHLWGLSRDVHAVAQHWHPAIQSNDWSTWLTKLVNS